MAATTQSKADATPAPDEGGTVSKSRGHSGGTEDMPVGHDEEIAVIFREMRHALNLPADQLAVRLKTPAATLEALEHGNIPALPEWAETCRVINAYTEILGLDSRPILRRLKNRLSALSPAQEEGEAAAAVPQPQAAPAAPPPGPPAPPGVKAQPPPPPGAPSAPPAAGKKPEPAAAAPQMAQPRGAEGKARPKGKRFSLSAVVSWLLLLVFFAVMAMGVVYLVANPKRVWTTVESLPEPVSRTIRSVWELVRPLDDGDSGTVIVDPNRHKSDKLPQSPRN
jgi:hypothetical protein